MSKEYDNKNKGALFGNSRKREGKKDPDLQGRLNIDGVDHWISAWFFNYDKDGKTRRGISLSLGKPCEDQDHDDKRPKEPAEDSEIPF